MDMPSLERTITICNPEGLHLRPAEMFAQLAQRYESEIEVIRESLRVDAKSIMHVLTLGASQGTELVLHARGADAEEALEALTQLVNSDFETDETLRQESQG